MFVAALTSTRVPALAWLVVALGCGSSPVMAELAKPSTPLCKGCEEVCAAYRDEWKAYRATLDGLAKKEQELKADFKTADEELEKARRRDDTVRQAHYEKERERIKGEIDKIEPGRNNARRQVESRQSGVDTCIKRDCFTGGDGAAPSSPAGKAEKCQECAAIADRIALLDVRIGELVEVDGVIRAAGQGAFAKSQLEAVDELIHPLLVAKGRAQKELEACRERTKERCEPEKKEPAPAAVFDGCLVGQWKSEPVSVSGQKTKGGDGIVMTIMADGTLTIDYDKMTAIPASSVGVGANLWQGKATGQIEANNGIARVKRVEKSDITWKFTDAQGKVRVSPLSGLGPIALGNNVMDRSYRCNDTTLTYKSPPREFTFKRVP